MPKFSGAQAPPSQAFSPVRTTTERTTTHEGAGAWSRDAKSDLFLLAVTNMVGEDTFYEGSGERDERFRSLIATVTAEDPEWVARFVPYLRNTMQMRSASVVMACEYVKAGGSHGRAVIDSACTRADEPAEVLGYWASRYGRRFPQPVKRGVADAVRRLYTERNALRYDGLSRSWRMADVIELVHPKPISEAQGALFKYLLDRRHHEGVPNGLLPLISAAARLEALPEDARRAALRENPGALTEAGFSWERLSGWLPGGMDAEAWEAVIPQMGVMALLRNLRNFDQAGISEAAIDAVIAKVTSAEDVRASRIFPFRVWAAYREAPSDNWKRALAKTLDLTTANIPPLDRSLVVVDCSGSMRSGVSGRSKLARWEVAAVTAAALWKGTKDTDIVLFGQGNARLEIERGTSALRVVDGIAEAVRVGAVGHATYGHSAITAHFKPHHARVLLVTDDQMMDTHVNLSHVPTIFTVNLAGYAPSSLGAGRDGRHSLGGFSDAAFRLVEVLDRGRDQAWPF